MLCGYTIRSPLFTAQGNLIQGNLIGLNAAGTGPIPNTEEGIGVLRRFNNTVGGTQTEAANKIAFNDGHGVWLFSRGARITVRGNSIFSNDGLGIDLGDQTGVTPNDATDSDDGGKQPAKFPRVNVGDVHREQHHNSREV